MRHFWYRKLATMLTQTSGRRRQPGSRRQWPCRPHIEPLEARLVLFEHVWSHGSCITVCADTWSDESGWSNGSPAGDPDPAGAVLTFPEDAGSGWDANFDDIPGELPVNSLFYHRGGFTSLTFGGSVLLSHDIFTDLAGTTEMVIPIRFTNDQRGFEHQIAVNSTGLLELGGDLSGDAPALLDKTGTGTLELSGNDQNYLGAIALHVGTLQLASSTALASGTTISVLDAGATLDLNNFNVNTTINADVDGTIRLGSGSLFLSNGSSAFVQGTITGTGGLTVDGPLSDVFFSSTGTYSYTGPTLVNNGGTLTVDAMAASSPITILNGGALLGDGTVGAVDVRGGLLHPGLLIATPVPGLTSQGNVLLEPGSSFEADIHGSGVNHYDHLTATGTIDLSNGETSLIVTGGANSAEGDVDTILHSSTGIVGTFAGLPDGSVFAVDHKMFQINYTANDVVLTHLPVFSPPVSYPLDHHIDPNSVHPIAVGDFNGDGIPDLVVANATFPGSVTVLLGNGDGSFQSQPDIIVPNETLAVAVGDFNGDGILDIAVTSFGSSGGLPGELYVLLGNGDGTFQDPVSYTVGFGPIDVEVGDVNGDGAADLVVFNQGDNGGAGSLSLLYNNGDGTFQDAQTLPPFPGYRTSAVAVADLGSGLLDLIVGNDGGGGISNVVSVLVNQGNDADGHAIFRHDMTDDYPAGNSLSTDIDSLAVGDFNNDGMPDVLWVDRRSGEVDVLLGNGDGTLQGMPIQSPAPDIVGFLTGALAVGDFDGDGNLDVTMPLNLSGISEGVLYGKGDGTFGVTSRYTIGGGSQSGPIAVVAADFNGDGAPDLVMVTVGFSTDSLWILLNMGFGGGPAPRRGGRSPRHEPAALHPSAAALAALADTHAAASVPSTPSCPTIRDQGANHTADVPATWMAPLVLALGDSHTPPPVLDPLFAVSDSLDCVDLAMIDLERTKL